MKPGNAPLKSVRLLDQVRERIRYLHYSLSTEKVYLHWVKFFIRWHGRDGRMKHPRDMGLREVEAFLTMLATERNSPTWDLTPIQLRHLQGLGRWSPADFWAFDSMRRGAMAQTRADKNQWNCSSSVEPVRAVTLDLPP